MLLDDLLIGSATIGLCVVIHLSVIIMAIGVMRRHAYHWLAWRFYPAAALIMTGLVVGFLLAHTMEICLWAALYIHLGEFTDLTEAVYFSTVTFTTLGYGDITLTNHWQFLSGLEAAGGILLFGLSAGASVPVMMAIFEYQNDGNHGPG